MTLIHTFKQPASELHDGISFQPAAMPPALNYETPPAFAGSAVWAQGNQVMANNRTVFPLRCIGCNGEEKLKMKRKLITWAPPQAYLALFLGWLAGGLVALLLERKVQIGFATCRHCRRRVGMRWLATLGIVMAAVVAFGLGAAIHPSFSLAGLAMLLAAILYGAAATRLYTVISIRNNVVTLKGMGKAFVASLDQH